MYVPRHKQLQDTQSLLLLNPGGNTAVSECIWSTTRGLGQYRACVVMADVSINSGISVSYALPSACVVDGLSAIIKHVYTVCLLTQIQRDSIILQAPMNYSCKLLHRYFYMLLPHNRSMYMYATEVISTCIYEIPTKQLESPVFISSGELKS